MLMAEVMLYCPDPRLGGKTVKYYGGPRPSRTMARDMTDSGWSLEDASGAWMVWVAESGPGRMPMVCSVFYYRPGVSLVKAA